MTDLVFIRFKIILREYIDSKANVPVRVSGILEKELKEKASKVLTLQRKGSKLIFPNVLESESKLINQENSDDKYLV